MRILVTGSNGFVGRNLVENLKNIRDGKNRTRTVQVDEIYGVDPSVISEVGTDGWNRVEAAINSTWRDAIVSPYLMFAGSDSRHWGRISKKVYRFSAMALTKEERGTIHGNDERIPTDTIKKTVEFYIRLIKTC